MKTNARRTAGGMHMGRKMTGFIVSKWVTIHMPDMRRRRKVYRPWIMGCLAPNRRGLVISRKKRNRGFHSLFLT